MSDMPTTATHHGMSPTVLYYILDQMSIHISNFIVEIYDPYNMVQLKRYNLQCQWTDCPAKIKIPMPMESLILYIFPS